MSLRRRIAIIAALATALTAMAVAAFGYGIARRSVLHEVDAGLQRDAVRIGRQVATRIWGARPIIGNPLAQQQLIDSQGAVVATSFAESLAPDRADTAVAAGTRSAHFAERTIDGESQRILTVALLDTLPSGIRTRESTRRAAVGNLALQVVRPLDATDEQLHRLALGFGLLGVLGTVGAAVAATAATRAGVRPVEDLARFADDVARRGDLTLDAPETGGAELARLGRSFNTMLRGLRDARSRQSQLVDDAAHELRTPITSMQTNIDLLARFDRLTPDDRTDVIAQIREQFGELRVLVNDLGVLATDDAGDAELMALDLAEVAERALARARRRATGRNVSIEAELLVCYIEGAENPLERAIVNLLDNAVKWSPLGSSVELRVQQGVVTVADRGPGMTAEQRVKAFDRFWRAPESRGLPGSGLGLAIVASVAHLHHGTVVLSERPGGGTIATLRIPMIGTAP